MKKILNKRLNWDKYTWEDFEDICFEYVSERYNSDAYIVQITQRKKDGGRDIIISDIIIPHLPSFVNPFPTNSYFFQHKTSPFSPFSKGAFRIFTILILCRRQNPHSVSRVESF